MILGGGSIPRRLLSYVVWIGGGSVSGCSSTRNSSRAGSLPPPRTTSRCNKKVMVGTSRPGFRYIFVMCIGLGCCPLPPLPILVHTCEWDSPRHGHGLWYRHWLEYPKAGRNVTQKASTAQLAWPAYACAKSVRIGRRGCRGHALPWAFPCPTSPWLGLPSHRW
jgi:hypothetical protein